MEVIRGRESDCRQEIRGQARRGGTRSAHELIRKGKGSAQLLTKARILLKADVSELAKVGATARSPPRWTPASPRSSGPGASWSRKGSRRC